MTSEATVFRATGSGRDDGIPGPPLLALRRRARPQAIYGAGLWVFIGVATTLFSLFIMAYVMRMSGDDAVSIEMPRQLWLSTALLLLGSLLLHNASMAAAGGQAERTRTLLIAGGACAIAFIGVQGWAWLALLAQQVTLTGNPSGSFFFLLTAMHALHVTGGLIAWMIVVGRFRRIPGDPGWRVALCARYWHFLLLVWLALFACFTWITPDVARMICRTA